MRIYRLSFFILIFLFLFLEAGNAANEAAQTLTLDGIFYHKGTTTPLAESNISVKIQILDPSKTCLLYEESQTVDTSSTKGYFNLLVGSSTGSSKRTASDPGRTMAQVFQNLSAITAASVPGQTCAGNSYSPSAGDTRYFRITVTSASLGVADTLTPDIVMNSVPSAIVAQSLQGLERSNVLTVNNSGSIALTQGNLEALFTTPGYTYLQAILNGQFMQTDSSGASLPSYASSPSGASTGDIWYDSTTNQIKYQSNVGEQTLGTSTGGISSISTGSAISINGSVAGAVSSGSATIDLSNTGVTAGTYAKVTVDAKGRVTAGSVSLTEAELPVIVTAGKVSGNAITSGTISGSTGINTSGNLVTSATVSGLTVQATNLRIYNGSHYFQFTAQAMSSDITFALPTAVGISGQVLSTDGVGTLSWITPSSGTSGTISVGQGGTGTTSYTANRLIASNGTGTALVATSCGLNQVISFDGSGNITCANVNSLAGMIMNGGNTTAGTISIGTNDNQALSFKTNNTVAMTISQSGNVGIGTTTPGTKLAVSSVIANTGLVDFSNSNNATLTAATNVNMYSNYTAFGSAAAGDLTGQKVTNYLTHSIDSPSANLVGLDIINTKNSAYTMGDMIGLRVTSNHIDAAGSGIKTNNIYGVKNSLSVMTGASDSVQNAYGEYISTSLSSGTLTNSYGLYVGTIQGTNKWSIYSSDSTTPSYLAGNVGIGVTSPTSSLDISGAITAQGMSSAPAVSASNTGRIYYDYSANKFKVSQNGGAYADLVNASSGSGFVNGGNAFSVSATLGTTDNHSLSIVTNNTAAMTISQSGNVGIGTISPSNKLDVNGNGRFYGDSTTSLSASTAHTTGYPAFVTYRSRGTHASPINVGNNDIITLLTGLGYYGGSFTEAASIKFEVDGAPGASDMPGRIVFSTTLDGSGLASERMRIANNGNVGIGTTNPSQPLEVVGTVQATDFVSTSDRRLKRDITSIEDALDKIVQINGVTWKWLSDGTTDMGVIAQDVEKVFPELVVTNSYGKKSVKYGNLVGPLIEAVKSLKAEIEALKSSKAEIESIQALKAENQDLKLRLEKLEKRLDATEGKVEGR